MGLSKKQKKQLEFEVIPHELRLDIARLFRKCTLTDDSNVSIIKKNRIINIGRQIEGKPLYRLETDDEYYLPPEHAWHFAELELITIRTDTIQFIDMIHDLLSEDILPIEKINEIFADHNMLLEFIDDDDGEIYIEIDNDQTIPDDNLSSEHPNIRLLVNRMELLLSNNDFSGVLHTCGTIFETLAKDVIKNPNIENQTLGSFFESYRQKSGFPNEVLDLIIKIYKKRNTEPLAGHGQTALPTINKEEAIILAEMTKSFIRMERKFSEERINIT
ncbi:hypothetical protein JWG41_09380 [Leptospira sp. 201903075]|uniref:hypothetical protein n=1 Tax=Leptospira chreensis TaxID=2810035 RepID=UPI00196390C0|nr:hypothetical protein [Leptospira chreensis]MBM9590653.1 hypothetical protein [Leptospira chreensis]